MKKWRRDRTLKNVLLSWSPLWEVGVQSCCRDPWKGFVKVTSLPCQATEGGEFASCLFLWFVKGYPPLGTLSWWCVGGVQATEGLSDSHDCGREVGGRMRQVGCGGGGCCHAASPQGWPLHHISGDRWSRWEAGGPWGILRPNSA